MNIYDKYDVISMHLPKNTYSSRNDTQISVVIVHCLGNKFEDIYESFSKLNVGSHYLVPKISSAKLKLLFPEQFSNFEPKFPDKVPIIEFIDESKRAHHAGVSNFSNFNQVIGCEKGLNSCSIGIVFHSEGYANSDGSINVVDMHKFADYNIEQQEIAVNLISHLMEKYNIPKENLLAHSTIAVGRKTDPGPLFFWKELNENGIGYLPKSKEIAIDLGDKESTIKFVQEKLFKIGFINCPQNNILDEATIDHINAYIIQFAPDLWKSKEVEITKELIENINGFDQNISCPENLMFAGVNISHDNEV